MQTVDVIYIPTNGKAQGTGRGRHGRPDPIASGPQYVARTGTTNRTHEIKTERQWKREMGS